MTRVLHIIGSADPSTGGPIEGARQVGAVWASQGHAQTLLTLDQPGDAHLSRFAPGEVVALGRRRSRSLWGRYRYVPGVVRWIREHRAEFDAVLVSGLWNYSVMAARLALVGSDTPYFVYTHGMLDPWFRGHYPWKHVAKQLFWLFNEGPLLRHARCVLFTTEDERRLAYRAFLPYKLKGCVVGYGTADVAGNPSAQVSALRRAIPALDDRPFLLFLGRLHEKKGCDLLVEAFGSLAADNGDLDLVIAGPDHDGMTAALRARAERLGVGGRVHFPGMLRDDLKVGAFRACEAFVLPSHQENFGVAVAEALACARPVLISDKVNIWREVEADGAGLVAADTADGARSLLARFLAMAADDRRAMGDAARACFLRRYTVEAAAGKLLGVMQEEIGHGDRS